MSSSDLLKEPHIVNAKVYIEDERIDFVSLSLEQTFAGHHTFRVVTDYGTPGLDFMKNPSERLKLIGRFLDIDLQQGNDGARAYEFRGLIREVHIDARDGQHGYAVLEGSSPTILLERGKRFDIFCNMSLNRVFDEITEDIGNKRDRLPCVCNPAYTGPVEFLMQYMESDWDFLRRLSAISGETLLYTGRDLVFGEYKDWAPVEVVYDKEVTDFQFGMRLLPNNFTRYQYLPHTDDTITRDAPVRIERADGYVYLAADRSKNLTDKRPVRSPVPLPVGDVGSLDEMVSREKSVRASETVYVKGTAKTCAVRIGRLVTVNMPENMKGAEDLGTYRIVRVRHEIDQNHRYRCEFEGVPGALKVFPTPEVDMPVAESVTALVIGNDDPLGQGRVRVEFPFVRDRVNDAWLRVMTPNAGSSRAVSKNRGMVFIPEKYDQVMVGFEFGDPNRPYVMGSMFHGLNGAGGGKNNHLKSLVSNEGGTLEFDDAAATLGITIKDRNGNFVHVNTKGNNIEITALDTITLNAKNVVINAEDDIRAFSGNDTNMQVGNNLHQIVDREFQLLADESKIIINEKHTLVAQASETTADKVVIDSMKEDMDLNSSKKVNVQSAQDVNLF